MSRTAFTYLVLCHTDPVGVLRLVRRIRKLSPSAKILVRYNEAEFLRPDDVADAGGIAFVSGRRVGWGDWTQVEMVVEALAAARQMTWSDRYVIISGQDYPIRDLATWEAEVVASEGRAVLDVMVAQPKSVDMRWKVIPEPGGGGRGIARRAMRALGGWAGRAAGANFELYPVTRDNGTRWWFGRPRREAPPIEVVKAALWMTLADEVVVELLRSFAEDGETRDFFRCVRTPDEYYFASLINAAGFPILYAATSAKRFDLDAPSPRWVGLDELAELAVTEAAFARKIPTNVDPEVIAKADELSSPH